MTEPAREAPMGVHQFIRDLGVRVRIDDLEDPTATLRIGFAGPIDVGLLAVLVDVLGGMLVLRSGDPCGISTTEMTMHGLHRLQGPGTLFARAQLVSITANRGCVEIDLAMDGSSRGSAASTVVFKRWPGVEIPVPDRRGLADSEGSVDEPLWKRVGVEQVSDGVAQIELRHELTNHVASLQGGVTASLLEAAAASRLDPTTELRSVTLTYLAQGRQGPFRATARCTGPDPDVIVASVLDLGHERPVAHAIFATAPTRVERP